MSEEPRKMVEQDAGKGADEQYNRHGKKMKQTQPKKPQRGQKKTKNKIPGAEITRPPLATQSKHEAVSITSDGNSMDVKDPAVISPPKKSRASKKRKDGYDPDQLSSGIVVPSVQRLAAATQATVRVHDVVQRPAGTSGVSKRQQEINQLKRRFPGLSSIEEGTDCYNIPFVPSDPDFPYELPELLVNLLIPEDYPKSATLLKVQNGLEVGFARNVERSFEDERIGFGFAGRGLLGMLTWLDRNLERILGMKKSNTIKIVRPQIQPTSDSPGHGPPNSLNKARVDAAALSEPLPESTNDEFSAEQLQEASKIRSKELSNLRLIHPSKIQEDSFLLDLSPTISVQLQVPQSFPLKSAWLMVVKGDHKHEKAANQILKENKRGLGRTINWLSANWHKLNDAQPEVKVAQPIKTAQADITIPVYGTRKPEFSDYDGFVLVANQVYQVQTDGEDLDIDEDYSSGDDFDDFSNLDHGIGDMSIEQNVNSGSDSTTKDHKATTIGTAQEKGTAINTAITLTYISLLEPLSLSLNLKCLRCKSSANHIESVQAGQSSEVQCPTCSSLLTVGFRGQALHAGNSRIGYLDLVGASVLDLGPGTFSPTCEKCDVVGAAFKGLVAGQPQTRPCRACHIKQSVAITSTSFLVVNSATKSANQGSRDAQNLNLQRGKALPNNGVCKHYRKSNRWFRFGCCNKVYACDHCHDSLTDHSMELARFQICGWCSKESAIRGLKPCVHCGRDLTRRSRGGYWEGGQGTRDQSKMSRNDPRKYRKKLGASSSK